MLYNKLKNYNKVSLTNIMPSRLDMTVIARASAELPPASYIAMINCVRFKWY
jgi:hypothetical protein